MVRRSLSPSAQHFRVPLADPLWSPQTTWISWLTAVTHGPTYLAMVTSSHISLKASEPVTWEAVAAVSSIMNVVVVVAAVVYTHMQLGEASRARSAAVLLEFQGRHSSERLAAGRARLDRDEFADLEDLSVADRSLLEEIVDHQETLAMLVELQLLDPQVARTVFRYSPSRVWTKAQHFIEEQRAITPGYGDYLGRYVDRYG